MKKIFRFPVYLLSHHRTNEMKIQFFFCYNEEINSTFNQWIQKL